MINKVEKVTLLIYLFLNFNIKKEKKVGQMDHTTKEDTIKARKTGQENSFGLMDRITKVNLKKIIYVVKVCHSIIKENIFGMTEELMTGSGKIAKCMVKEYLPGRTVGNTLENL